METCLTLANVGWMCLGAVVVLGVPLSVYAIYKGGCVYFKYKSMRQNNPKNLGRWETVKLAATEEVNETTWLNWVRGQSLEQLIPALRNQIADMKVKNKEQERKIAEQQTAIDGHKKENDERIAQLEQNFRKINVEKYNLTNENNKLKEDLAEQKKTYKETEAANNERFADMEGRMEEMMRGIMPVQETTHE